MATYAIGDIQGHFDALMGLLDTIAFDSAKDTLWCVGDLVNRGPKSLETLRFLKNLGGRVKVVLGNHDLHLLALYYGLRSAYPDDTLTSVLAAHDAAELVEWLCQQPLVYSEGEYTMVHAGLFQGWTLAQALALSAEVSSALQGDQRLAFLSNMYGNSPDVWSDDLSGMVRLRVIKNYCTCMRFCSADGHLVAGSKTAPIDCPPGAMPWFNVPQRRVTTPIVFGHWSALQGETHTKNVFALDTGVAWGGALTAMRLEDRQRFSYLIPNPLKKHIN
jgi:bis(5'-nucleosyl)-tetraphosphatase (symmetrical)